MCCQTVCVVNQQHFHMSVTWEVTGTWKQREENER